MEHLSDNWNNCPNCGTSVLSLEHVGARAVAAVGAFVAAAGRADVAETALLVLALAGLELVADARAVVLEAEDSCLLT